MRTVGVSELRQHASEIVQVVREGRGEYIITHRGKPVARLVRYKEASQPRELSRELSPEEFWLEMDNLIRQMEAAMPADAKSPLQQLFEDREASARRGLGGE